MPAPHSKGKRSNKNKKGKALQRQRTRNDQAADTAVAEQPNAAIPAKTGPAAAATASPRKASSFKSPTRQYSVPEYPYVSGELIRIGITAGVLIVILIILSIVL